jgi:hypothetical protein
MAGGGAFQSARSSCGLTPINRYTVPRNSPVGGAQSTALKPRTMAVSPRNMLPRRHRERRLRRSFLADLGSLAAVGIASWGVRLAGRRARAIVDSGCGTVGAWSHRRTAELAELPSRQAELFQSFTVMVVEPEHLAPARIR